ICRFLLEPNDPRAAELRRRFVFKLVPLLNPDGVAAGHFRQDSYGNNLNRHYIDPDVEKHSSVYASKAVVMHHAARPSGRASSRTPDVRIGLTPLVATPNGMAFKHQVAPTNLAFRARACHRFFSRASLPPARSPCSLDGWLLLGWVADLACGLRGRLTLYLDLHAHASARGCFIYGNHLPSLEDQAENQLLPLLMTINTPHFDFGSCNFTLKHMCRVDSGDAGLSAEGTGRVFYGKHAGVLRSYTLECNYNTGKAMCNHIPSANGGRRGERFASPERKSTTSPRYHPQIWRDVGAGFLKALLDAEGASVWSRLPQSKFRSLERARKHLINELRNQPSYREQSLLLRRGASFPATPPLPTPPQEPGLRGKRRGSTGSVFGGAGGASPSLSSGQSSSLDKAPAATITADLAGAGKSGGGATASSSETDNSRKLPSSRPPPPLLPRRPDRTPPAVGRKVSTSRSRSGESVHRTSSRIGGGGGITVVPTRRIGSGSSGSGSRSGSGRSSSRAGASSVSRKSGATRERAKAAAARRKPPSPNPGRCRSASREARRGQQSAGRSKRGNGSSSSGRGRGTGGGERGGGDDGGGGTKAVRSSSSRSERRRGGGASTSSPSSRGRSAAALDRSRHVRRHSKKQYHHQRLQKAQPPLVVPLLPKYPVVSSSCRYNTRLLQQQQQQQQQQQ
ncbi:unnamed protein product, partial [Ectocarpus fasciculatus]